MFKKIISTVLTIIVTVSITVSAYANEGVLESISAGAARKATVSADSGVKASKATDSKKTSKADDAGKTVKTVSGEKMVKVDSSNEKKDAKTTSDDKADETISSDSAKPDESKQSESKSSDSKELCVADVEDSVNVRAEASEESGVVGYMYKDCVGETIERKDGWTRIRSGVLEGWVKDDYLLFGDDAKEKTDGALMEIAVVNAEKLRVRAEASEDADIKAMLTFGEEVEIIGSEGSDWTKISFEDGTSGEGTGYVSNDYITKKTSYKTGETKEQVENREEKSREAKEEAEKEDKEEKKSEAKSSDGDSSKQAEEIEISTEEVEAAAETKTEAAVTDNGAVSASVDDETLLAALIQCECNGPYESQLAVGAVVVNRAKYGYGSISNAIYAPYQFGPASSGKLARTLATGAISASARQAAHDAISGLSNIGTARYFRNVSSGHAGIVIGNHVYW